MVGHDWSEDHHDVYLMKPDGSRLVSRCLGEGVEGVAAFHELVSEFVDDPSRVHIGTETDRGLWIQSLIAAGYRVYVINPKAVARYRDRHHVSGGKSDAGDAKVLADLVRTDRHLHREVAGDSDEVEAIKVLARAHQSLIWTRVRHTNQLRSTLREFFPQALEAFGDLAHPDAVAVLGRASTPQVAARLSITQIKAALKHGGRQRRLQPRAEEIQHAFRRPQLAAPLVIETAMGQAVGALVSLIEVCNTQIGELEAGLDDRFRQHPDAAIYLSQPGIGVVIGARTLGEFGDDPNRYASPKSRKNYAGTSPITRASGRTRIVTARHIGNRRLYDAINRWAQSALTASPGARTYYDQHKAVGASHNQALRALGNRLVGILHGCLHHRTPYNEHTAWAHRTPTTANIAA